MYKIYIALITTLLLTVALDINALSRDKKSTKTSVQEVKLENKIKRSYPGTVSNIVDGDTIDVIANLGLNVFVHERFRLNNIDAWEMRGEERPKGILAKKFVEDNCPTGTIIRIDSLEKRGKFGRWLGDIYYFKNGKLVSLSEELIINGHAEIY